jgi:hypothetical protein
MTIFHLPRHRRGHTVIVIKTGIPEKIIRVERLESKMVGSFYKYETASGEYYENELRQNKL